MLNSSTDLKFLTRSAKKVAAQMVADADSMGVEVHTIAGATVLDFAIKRPGKLAGGLGLAELCLGGLAVVRLESRFDSELELPVVTVATDWPLLACIASQYAGWAFSTENYFAMCSGPARVNRGQEPILDAYGLSGKFSPAIGVFECNSIPGEAEIEAFAEACHVSSNQVVIAIARTASFPGTLQVVARSVETALHKLHELQFDLQTVVAAFGSAPLPPIANDDLTALGWTNDAILYGGCVNLWVDTTNAAIESILAKLPSSSSVDFGDPFIETFLRYEKDFYKIDKLLFSPAKVIFNNLRTGKVFVGGEIRVDILRRSFGI